MRTTLNLNDDLLARAKALAARERTTLTRLIEEGLRLRLRRPDRSKEEAAPPLPIFREGTGMAPGIDALSNRSLLDAADDADLEAGKLR